VSHSSSHNWSLVLKLRSNVELEGDLQLAAMEITKLLGRPPEPLNKPAFDSLVSEGTLRPADARHHRDNGVVAYRVRVEVLDPARLFQRLSFVELAVGDATLPREHWHKVLPNFEDVPSTFIRLEFGEGRIRFRLAPFNTVAEWSDVAAKRAASPDDAVKALQRTLTLALEGIMPDRRDAIPERAMSASLTTGHLFHGLHVYKAKFFPRMVRVLLNFCAPRPDARVLDPYAGSGTALTESTVMSMSSAGVDIDPLSALIATAKVDLLHDAGEAALENALKAKELHSNSKCNPEKIILHSGSGIPGTSLVGY
jgi:hypothetical protein